MQTVTTPQTNEARNTALSPSEFGEVWLVSERKPGMPLTLVSSNNKGDVVEAKRSVSCLIEPQQGDHVLVHSVGGKVYVLAVLERPDTPINGEAEQASKKFRLSIPGELVIDAEKITFRSKVAVFLVDSLNMAGRSFRALFENFARISQKDTSMSTLSSNHALNRVDIVDNVDVQQSGTLKQDSDGAMALTSKVAIIKSDQDIRIDGERVNLG